MTDSNERNLIVSTSGTAASEKFNIKIITPFFERSVSEETRRAYRRHCQRVFYLLQIPASGGNQSRRCASGGANSLIENKKSAGDRAAETISRALAVRLSENRRTNREQPGTGETGAPAGAVRRPARAGFN